ncbi:pyridoxamine 5'-phosphate oxidase-related FMN-binding [Caldalkalibacillus thermarum TA2.A1]|uniref:Pyridoxamine 5'-phosphate oxidase family protein n=1 Tax=Caldalkalibacillus thermarum (strain TA2.A1) TaxID=986075 RepID=F5L860_CALTT|nr:pyridoxamine 5'-phosphate oxidase family protein [Caldalkalibacillus thermarum]EGL82473.1 pyridoxamine 5'-phosphate oxidase-related FMN-binding [Caldalkalibacillus thermarum TA2.A1]QZT33178.1 pyridoxamine 5'-phosphate oxidase family protein [Caldalkalibacillus thermarum TA2.A1]
MAEKVWQSLPDELFSLLQKERFVTLATIDHETGVPNVSAISWVYAPSKSEVRIAVASRSRIVENIKANPSAVLNLIGAGSCYSIAGEAKVAVEKMDGVSIKLSRIDLAVKEVRDVMFYGARISVDPEYEKTYDKEAADKLDRQVLEALKA